MTSRAAELSMDSERRAFLYVIGSPLGPQKIGVSNAPDRRLVILQVSSTSKLEVAFTLLAPRALAFVAERNSHWILRDRRVHGEWYAVSPAEAEAAVRAAYRDALDGSRRPRQGGEKKFGRKRINEEQTPARLPAGTLARIDAVLDGQEGEKRADFIREAVERELKRRERQAAR